MTALIATAAQDRGMSAEYDGGAETCAHCGSDIWVDGEIGVYFDVRALNGDNWAFRCPESVREHEPVD